MMLTGSAAAAQENYLKTKPKRLIGLDGPELQIEQMDSLDRAASAISDGDLVDAMIHGYG